MTEMGRQEGAAWKWMFIDQYDVVNFVLTALGADFAAGTGHQGGAAGQAERGKGIAHLTACGEPSPKL